MAGRTSSADRATVLVKEVEMTEELLVIRCQPAVAHLRWALSRRAMLLRRKRSMERR
jgi:hypothetical protein